MQLPTVILNDVLRFFEPHHPAWHLARVPKEEVEPDDEFEWTAARKMFPTVKFRHETGASEQFLTFHRDMMREYKWILDQHPDVGLSYNPWLKIPDVFAAVVDSGISEVRGYTEIGEVRLRDLVENATLDVLGAFVESRSSGATDGQGLHNLTHVALGIIERELGLPEEFSMGAPSSAHRNTLFYRLHGWIDELYASWQRAHGEQPDLTPKMPDMYGHTRVLSVGLNNGVSFQRIADAADRLAGFRRLGK